jgi:hypothetical protein
MKYIAITFLAAAMFSITSCKQCTECTKYPGDPIKLCKKDYASDDSYNDRFRYLVSEGYRCD